MGSGEMRVPFTVMLPAEIVDELHEAARQRGMADEAVGAEALERGLAQLPELTVAWMKGSRFRLSMGAVAALGHPRALVIDVLGGNTLELLPATSGIEIRYNRCGQASFDARELRRLAEPQTVWLREERGALIGRLVGPNPPTRRGRSVATNSGASTFEPIGQRARSLVQGFGVAQAPEEEAPSRQAPGPSDR